MHSLWELTPWLRDEPFVLTTVDTIFREEEFARYVDAFQHLVTHSEVDGLMGVTDYIDDEKPLYVSTTDDLCITGFLDDCDAPRYISGGIYGLTPRCLETLRRCVERGESRMRNFQRALVRDGLRLRAWPFSKVLDIDHADDIRKAEEFLRAQSSKLKVMMVRREERFSPNSVEKDLAILEAVAERLMELSPILLQGEEVLRRLPLPMERGGVEAILSMSRSPETLAWLKTLNGIRIINAPEGVENCTRSRLHAIMARIGIAFPSADGPDGYWLKRGDAPAQSQDDVQYAANRQELESKIRSFEARGITDYIISAHVIGDLVKFYGVLGTGFFHVCYPSDEGHSKFGLETHNGSARHYPFSHQALQHEAERLAAAVGIEVYGGDCIIKADGTFCFIDFNDWPSFSPCRSAAATAIAALLI